MFLSKYSGASSPSLPGWLGVLQVATDVSNKYDFLYPDLVEGRTQLLPPLLSIPLFSLALPLSANSLFIFSEECDRPFLTEAHLPYLTSSNETLCSDRFLAALFSSHSKFME
jgi:hypothetical protein